MEIIIHRIRLRDGVDPQRFEAWVRLVDYASCPDLPSVRAFSVQRSDVGPGAYFEVIQVTSRTEFDKDMKLMTFQRLVSEFGEMAEVTEELAGERIEPGYVQASGH